MRTFELPSDVSIGELRELFAWFAKQSVAASGEHPQGDPRWGDQQAGWLLGVKPCGEKKLLYRSIVKLPGGAVYR